MVLLAGRNCFSQVILSFVSVVIMYAPHTLVPRPRGLCSWIFCTSIPNSETYQYCKKLSPQSRLLSSSSCSLSLSRRPLVDCDLGTYCGVCLRLSVAGRECFFSEVMAWSLPDFLLTWCFAPFSWVRGDNGGGEYAPAVCVRTGGGRDCAIW